MTKIPSIDLVVARHREDLRWLRRVPPGIRTRVYDKGGAAGGKSIPLPNVGREAHTYLHHIVTQYDDLAEWTVFAQGHPFDHVSTFHHILRELAAGLVPARNFVWMGFIIDWDDATGSQLYRRWSKNPHGIPLDMEGFSQRLWEKPADERYVFYPGANFMVRRTLIGRQPKEFYERALHVAASFPDAAHCFERTWDRMFATDGLPEEHRGKTLPIYTKPIRRLIDAEVQALPTAGAGPHPTPSAQPSF